MTEREKESGDIETSLRETLDKMEEKLKRAPRDITLTDGRRHGYSDRGTDYLYDRIYQGKGTISPHQYQGARPKVRFEADQFDKEKDYLPRDNLPYRSNLETWMKSVEEGMKCIIEELKELRSSRQKNNDDRWFRSDRANNNNQERRCYECKQTGHFRRNCPELRRRRKQHDSLDKGQKDNAQGDKNAARRPNVSVGSSVEECGLYVEVQVQGEKAKFLVDTGATVTLVSETLYKKLPVAIRPNLREVSQSIWTANSTPLSVHGKAEFNICVDQVTCYNDAIVANLKIDGTTVGQLSKVNTVQNMLSDEDPQSADMLRKDLAEMLQKTVDTLTPEEHKEAKAFLLKLRLKYDQVLREEVVEEASSQVETNQSATSNVKADVISDEGSETDEIDNDVNLGATGGSRIRRQPKWLQDYVQCEDSLSRDLHEEESSDEEEWLSQEPDITIDEEPGTSNKEPRDFIATSGPSPCEKAVDPTVRKRTQPMPVYTPDRCKTPRLDDKTNDPTCKVADKAVQTDPVVYTKSIKTTTIVREHGRKTITVKREKML
uniref:CCHC-type domain-containing protein n=1 Tax=Magallana gigas TaxID=29159 RepID=A0A8W8NKK2_MAGGI